MASASARGGDEDSKGQLLRLLWWQYNSDAGWSSSVARRAHNPKVVGSNPAPATNLFVSMASALRGGGDKDSKGQLLCLLWWQYNSDAGWSSSVARRAHNPKVVGSNPAPATNYLYPWQAHSAAVEAKTARGNCSVSCGGNTIRTRGGAAR